ncbi:MAG: serine acetyltransferase [Clostridia bacterium]|nr:serine acetyltransferase [Clostridia bacterium]
MEFDKRTEEVVNSILNSYDGGKVIDGIDMSRQPDKKAIIDIVGKLLKILYPGYYSDRIYRQYSLKNNMAATIEDVIFNLNKHITLVCRYGHAFEDMSEEELRDKIAEITFEFLEKIPQIRETLETDIDAFYEGDPAAYSKAEILLSYPGLMAISIYRMAHELYLLGVPMMPRIMTEYGHSLTGVDIHPGAKIGKYFFIDHGTGIVIGETTVIGDHVKIYQGVTLGGLSTRGGQAMKGTKRHPTIGNNVTIYSGASILGGHTVIEDDVVIGGNVFITDSVRSGSRVLFSDLCDRNCVVSQK